MKEIWVRGMHKGTAVIEPFDGRIEGVDYQSKIELDMIGRELWRPEALSKALMRIMQSPPTKVSYYARKAERIVPPYLGMAKTPYLKFRNSLIEDQIASR